MMKEKRGASGAREVAVITVIAGCCEHRQEQEDKHVVDLEVHDFFNRMMSLDVASSATHTSGKATNRQHYSGKGQDSSWLMARLPM